MEEKDDILMDEKEEKTSGDSSNQDNEDSQTAENQSKVSDDDAVEEKESAADGELSELKNKYLRLFAEFDNFKKRTIKEKLELMRTAAQDTMSALLPVLDDFDRAKKTSDDESTEEQFSEGVELVYQKLYAVLKARGLEPMESTGQPFDPELHEAVTDIPAPSEDMKGKVIDTIEQGYKLKDKIIRHAKVVVGV